MKKQKKKRGFNPLASMTAQIVDPLLQKKAGLNMRLVENWAEIVGQNVADAALPLKIVWPRQKNTLGGAQLVIGCSGYTALKLQHETGEIIAHINRFFGYQAIGKIKIEQKILPQSRARMQEDSLLGGTSWAKTAFGFKAVAKPTKMSENLKADIADIGDDDLRASLLRLGQRVHKS